MISRSRTFIPALLLTTSLASGSLTSHALSQDTAPEQAASARIELKEQLAIVMDGLESPFDTDGAPELSERQTDARLIAAILTAFPLLFPQGSSADDLAAAGSTDETSAVPAAFEDAEAYSAMARATAALARELAEVTEEAGFVAQTRELRSNCTACHDAYLDWQLDFSTEGGGDLLEGLGF